MPFLTIRRRLRDARRPWLLATALAVVLLFAAAGVAIIRNREPASTPGLTPTPSPTSPPPTQPSTAARALPMPRLLFGFYGAGLSLSRCYGSCTKDDPGYDEEQATKARIAELRGMGVNYVVSNQTITQRFRRDPDAVYALLADLHRNGIRVSYEVASAFFVDDRFDPTQAEQDFAKTDRDGDGISDLDGYLDVLFRGHEVMESETHEERVQVYRVAKKWFPTTPVTVYYGGFRRANAERWQARAHPRGGVYGDYAYGPGEADIVHVTVTEGRNDGFNPQQIAAGARERVQFVQRATPHVPVVIHTSFANDTRMDSDPDSMWTQQQMRQWYGALVSVPGVRGVLLRSYGRFTYDLAHPSFRQQRATWAQLGADAARRNRAGSGGAR